MKKMILCFAIVFSLTACIKEKQSIIPPVVTEPTIPSNTPQPHQYARFADSLNRSWLLGRSFYYLGPPSWDTATKQYTYNPTNITFTDSTMSITKVNDTTIQFIGVNLTLLKVDSTNKVATYSYRAHQYASDVKSVSYYYSNDSLYATDNYWVSSSTGYRTYKYYSK